MSRTSKILFVVGCGVLGLIAWGFFSAGQPGEVRLTLSSISSNRVVVTLTNTGAATLEFFSMHETFWPNSRADFPSESGTMPGHSARTFELRPEGTNQWRMRVLFGAILPSPYGSASPPWFPAFRIEIKNYAVNHGWPRVSQWMDPLRKTKTLWGPMMLGNQPVEAGLK